MTGSSSDPCPLRDAAEASVTAHQLPAVETDRDLFLEACPGSGKTRTAAARVARLARDGLRVAVCSYTNTGVEELRRALHRDIGHTLGPQHFSGTLHQFLLRYVLYPFGQLAIGCHGSPRVLGPDASVWPTIGFDKTTIRLGVQYFQFRPDGSLCVRTPPSTFPYDSATAVRMRGARARQQKQTLARRCGWVSTDDAMHWALEVLRHHPWVASAIARRFDEVLVDEAQDTSELQLACLRALHDTGALRSLTLIGDLDQSIYSYNGAHPAGCAELASRRGLETVVLSENRRCSQRICDVTAPLQRRGTPDTATGPDSACSWSPEVVLYPADDPAAVVDSFRARLLELGEELGRAAVLTRTNDLADRINRTATPAGVNTRALSIARLVHGLRHGATIGRRAVDRLERSLALLAWDREDLTGASVDELFALRRAVMALLAGAPALDTDLGSWTTALRAPMAEAIGLLTERPAHRIGQWLRVTAPMRDVPVADLAATAAPHLSARTVHDVKGSTFCAVALVLPRTRSSRRDDPAETLGRALSGVPTPAEAAEEMRIAYVALTRARRLCRVALPDSTSDATLALFTDHGFRRLDPA